MKSVNVFKINFYYNSYNKIKANKANGAHNQT